MLFAGMARPYPSRSTGTKKRAVPAMCIPNCDASTWLFCLTGVILWQPKMVPRVLVSSIPSKNSLVVCKKQLAPRCDALCCGHSSNRCRWDGDGRFTIPLSEKE